MLLQNLTSIWKYTYIALKISKLQTAHVLYMDVFSFNLVLNFLELSMGNIYEKSVLVYFCISWYYL